ncbi:unnamed protein product [Enterobius vermicularis]|uniref:Uncharacterized protein n=1 Tax=Enterobius vermicularis TaxID=51028 RepID=A0A0N4VDN0_ENTVE|nr:unnamed protein product [Enterobius vermicularis]
MEILIFIKKQRYEDPEWNMIELKEAFRKYLKKLHKDDCGQCGISCDSKKNYHGGNTVRNRLNQGTNELEDSTNDSNLAHYLPH